MKSLKSYFEIHSRFQNGIFLLAAILIVLLAVIIYDPFYGKNEDNLQQLTEFQNQVDSLKKASLVSRKEYLQKPFNPNFISDYKGYTLGLSTIEMDKLFAYRKKGKWINSAQDFKDVTGVSEEILQKISPLFKFPEWVARKNSVGNNKAKFTKSPKKTFEQKGDLNTVTSVLLVENIGVPDFIADRIINYRLQIDGFLQDDQLSDIRGLYAQQKEKILANYTVKSRATFEKINIHTASVNDLMTVPYFSFEVAINIHDYMKDGREILDFKELGNIEGFPLEKLNRIALYLKLK